MEHVQISKKLVVINSASSLVVRVLNVTVLLWSYQYLLAELSSDEFAVLPIAMALMVFAPLFFTFLSGGISRYIVDAYARNDINRVKDILSSIMPPIFAAILVFVVIASGITSSIDLFVNVPPNLVGTLQVMLMLLIASFCFQMFTTLYVAAFHVHQKFVELNAWGVIRDLVKLSLLVALLLGVSSSVVWVALATAVSEVFHSLAVYIRAKRIMPELGVDFGRYKPKLARQLMNFGIWTALGRLGATMYTNAGTILLNLYGTSSDVTSFYIGATIYRQIDSTVNLAAQPLQPVLTAMNAVSDQERFARTIFRGGTYALWASMFICLPLVFFADDFVRFYLDGKYADTALIIILMTSMFLFTNPTVLLAMASMSTAKVKEFFLPAFLFQVAGLILMLLALNVFNMGAIGVSVALVTITIVSQLTYFWWLMLRLTESSFSRFLFETLFPGTLPAVVSAVFYVSTLLLFPELGNTWAGIIGVCVVGGSIYLCTLYIAMSDSDRTTLHRLASRVLPSAR